MSDHEDGQQELLAEGQDPASLEKYVEAGKIADAAIAAVAALCVDGASVYALCAAGEEFIRVETGKLYSKAKDAEMMKGGAMPICLTINNTCGYFSPWESDDITLKNGDVVKIDAGVHFDGFPALSASTIVVGTEEVKGETADVIAACNAAAEVVLRMFKVDNVNNAITEAMAKVAEDFKVKPILGVLSHTVSKYVIDGDSVIISATAAENKVAETKLELYDIFVMDIVYSTGSGKPKQSEDRVTVFKAGVNEYFQPTLKASKNLWAVIENESTTFPFSLPQMATEVKNRRFGISELVKNEKVEEMPVLKETEGSIVAKKTFTVLIQPTGAKILSGGDFTLPANIKSDKVIVNAELLEVLKLPVNTKKKKAKRKKKKKKKTAAA